MSALQSTIQSDTPSPSFLADNRGQFDRLLTKHRASIEHAYREAIADGKDRPVVFVGDLTDSDARKVFALACEPHALAEYDARSLLPAGYTMAAVQWATDTRRAKAILNTAGLGNSAAALDQCWSWPMRAFNVVFLVPDRVIHIGPCPIPTLEPVEVSDGHQ